jgi:ribosomal protein S18 acetylase RimI-like enzyme
MATIVRELRITDIYAINRFYDSLFDESKRLFHPGFLGFESITPNWVLAQFALVASSFAFSKKLLLRIYPLAAFLVMVSTDKSGTIVGFAFVKHRSHKVKERLIGELGICVRDDYQGKHVGSELMDRLLAQVKNELFQRIYLTVLTDNLKAINMYEKYGFKKTWLMPKADAWRGKRFDSVEMRLNLN